MFKRLISDESGVAMGLAVIMVVLIGVMGAGLLVFVRNDLEAVVEVNQGQKAFDIADSGLQVARQHLALDKTATHYDVDDGTSCDAPGDGAAPNPNWSPSGGVTRTFAGGQFTVRIQWLNQDPTADPSCRAPKTTTSPSPGVDYFRVVSTGTVGPATRRVEAIYETYDLNVPRAYYTPGDVTISGSACIENVSIFSGSNIEFKGGGKCTDATGNNIGHMKGRDLTYKAWAATADPATSYPNPFNSTPRATADAGAGAGALGQITYTGGANSRIGTRDYDQPDADSDGAEFVQTPASGEMTYPFDVGKQPDADLLCDQAKDKGNYIRDNSSGNATLSNWPTNTSPRKNTVLCYEFTNTGSSHTLTWAVDGNDPLPPPYDNGEYTGCKASVREGTLVIKNGNFTIKPNTALFAGVVVVRGTTDSSELGEASLTGNVCLDGFVNSSGPITISGSVTPTVSAGTVDRPGFYGVRQWSWRELYQ